MSSSAGVVYQYFNHSRTIMMLLPSSVLCGFFHIEQTRNITHYIYILSHTVFPVTIVHTFQCTYLVYCICIHKLYTLPVTIVHTFPYPYP